MKLVLALLEEFGPHLADGETAAGFRLRRIEPYIGFCTEIVVDFSGVRNANSSFVNALVAGIVEQHGERVLEQLVFKGCNPAVRVLVEAAIDLGLLKTRGRVDA